MPTIETLNLQLILDETLDGLRLDQALSQLLPQYSRNLLQSWIKQGFIQVNQTHKKAKTMVSTGDEISIEARIEKRAAAQAQEIPLNIVTDEPEFLVINKPAGLIMHPGAGHPDGTMLNALLHHYPQLANLPRAGIIHRLDKDTSGLVVIAKTDLSYQYFVDAIQKRTVKREYRALVNGTLTAGGTTDAPIGRHASKRTRMAVVANGRPAVTHYRIIEKLASHTYLRVILDTGRTHQIRVHMAYIHHPLVGDPVYGRRPYLPKQASEEVKRQLQTFPRQALHACQLSFQHPINSSLCEYVAPLPDDMRELLIALGCQTGLI
jgi:23S rRNA pseudouridine1911/1915/1917 synthase